MDDVISRQVAINGMRFERGINDDGLLFVPFRDIKKHLESLPSAEPEPCEDAVSRLGAISHFRRIADATSSKEKYNEGFIDGLEFCIAHLSTMPTVSPKQRTGKWNDGNPICPVCGEDKFKDLDADIWADWKPKFCPNCGAEMKGDAE